MLGPDSRRSGGRGRAARPLGVALLLAVVLLAAACTSAGTQTIVPPPSTAAAPAGQAKTIDPPPTPAGSQLRWLIAELARLPMSDAQVRAHFDAAGKMISLSDNTAADMLINLLGRSAVEASLTSTGMASPAMNLLLLTTREIYVLKLRQWPTLAQRFISASQSGRRAVLASTVDQAPLPTLEQAGAWTMPRDIDSLEYFGSATDLCRAYASLAALDRQPGLSPIGQARRPARDAGRAYPAIASRAVTASGGRTRSAAAMFSRR